MQLDGEPVLFESVVWLARGPSHLTGIAKHVQRHGHFEKIHKPTLDSVVLWGTHVTGIKINSDWVKVGEYYLPLRLQEQQVLLPQESSRSSSRTENIRIFLLAPESKEYSLTGTPAGNWKSYLELEPVESQEVSPSLTDMLMPNQMYYVDVEASLLEDAEFKFQSPKEKGFFAKMQSVASYVLSGEDDSLFDWEYENTENNRTIKSDYPLSIVYMYYGNPEPLHNDVVAFIKVALSNASLQDLTLATSKVNEVRLSLLSVGCKHPTRAPQSIQSFDRCLHDALSQLLDGSTQPKPCGGLYMWLAMLEQEFNGNLRGLQFSCRQEILTLLSAWPSEVMSHVILEDHVCDLAKCTVLQEAGLSPVLSGQWLQAALQVVVNSAVSTEEVIELKKTVAANDFDLPNWAALGLQRVPLAKLESALRVGLGAGRPVKVWCAARHFLDHIQGADVRQACARIALEAALTCFGPNEEVNYEEILPGLGLVLEKLGQGACDAQLQCHLTKLIQQSWNNCSKVFIPTHGLEAKWNSNAFHILARAVTAEPGKAIHVEFRQQSEFCWFRAAAQCTEHVVA